MRLSQPNMHDTIIQQFANLQQFIEIAYSALKTARRQLINRSGNHDRLLSQIGYLIGGVEARKIELATQAGHGIESMKFALLTSKASQLSLCSERALSRLIAASESEDSLKGIGETSSEEDLASMVNQGDNEQLRSEKTRKKSDENRAGRDVVEGGVNNDEGGHEVDDEKANESSKGTLVIS